MEDPYALSEINLASRELPNNGIEGSIRLPWPNLISINVRGNLFERTLPVLPPSTWYFNASYNSFTTTIPGSFCELPSLWNLQLAHNNLFGAIPSCLGNSTHLVTSTSAITTLSIFTSIDLSKNNFWGAVPAEIGSLKSLNGLNLSHNILTGGIPPSISNFTDLEWLDLSVNMLDGTIPKRLADLTSLSYLNLSENGHVGEIPSGRQLNTFGSSSHNGNPGLCGFPPSRRLDVVVQSPVDRLWDWTGTGDFPGIYIPRNWEACMTRELHGQNQDEGDEDVKETFPGMKRCCCWTRSKSILRSSTLEELCDTNS